MKPTPTIATLLFLACNESPAPPLALDPPSGPAPIVSVSLGFDDSPLEGLVHLTPAEGTENWRYAVDVDEDGTPDHEGVLGLGIGFGYRFDEPGIHMITVQLRGPEGDATVQRPVVVNDADAVRLVARSEIESREQATFEGVTLDHAGAFLYVGDFWLGLIYQLDAADLTVTGPPLEVENGPEGLAVAGDSLLYAIHKRNFLSAISIPELQLEQVLGPFHGFFIEIIGGDRALISGQGSSMQLISLKNGTMIESLPGVWHFAVSPSGDRVVVQASHTPAVIQLLDLADFTIEASVQIDAAISVDAFVFSDDGAKIYALAPGEARPLFLVLDGRTGEVMRRVPVDLESCGGFCAANPVAISATGRYIAFERTFGDILIVDTELDLPLYQPPISGSVTAGPSGDVFYALTPGGVVSKFEVAP